MIHELTSEISFTSFKEEVLKDYKIVCLSRAVSLLGRKEVLTGKAKFGIFGDGKELPQIAMAKAFQKTSNLQHNVPLRRSACSDGRSSRITLGGAWLLDLGRIAVFDDGASCAALDKLQL